MTITVLPCILDINRILELGFGKDIEEILDILSSRKEGSADGKRQNLLLSATLNEKVNRLAKISLNKPVMLGLGERQTLSETLVEESGSLKSDNHEDSENAGDTIMAPPRDYRLPAQLVQTYVKGMSYWKTFFSSLEHVYNGPNLFCMQFLVVHDLQYFSLF